MSTHAIDRPQSPAARVPSPAQRRLLDAAIDAFAENGFGGTTTRDIAARAGRSPAAVYIHYPTKEDLLFAVSGLGHAEALACLAEATSRAGHPADRLRDMVAAFSTWHMDNAKLARVAQYEFAALSRPHRTEIAELRRGIQRLVRTVIDSGVQSGEFDVTDVPGAADAILSLSIDLIRWFDPTRRRHRTALAAQHAELAVRMVRGCPSRPPSAGRKAP